MPLDQSTVDSLIPNFRALGQPARSHALPALLAELTSQEWRELQHLVNARTFEYDVVGHLPLELVLHIFSFLDIAASCRLQTVCRRWHAVLNSATFLDQPLKDWYGAPLGLADNDEGKTLRLKMAEHIHRLCLGRPYSSTRSPLYIPMGHSVLVGDIFCYIKPNQRQVRLINLRTAKQAVVGSPRDITTIHASSEIVAFASNQKCYVRSTSVDSVTHKPFRIPCVGLQRALTCSGRSVAYTYTACQHFRPPKLTVYLFDYDSGRGHSFDCEDTIRIATNVEWHPNVLLDSGYRTVTAICRNKSLPLVHYVTYSFNGDEISRGSTRLRGARAAIIEGTGVIDSKGTMAVYISSVNDGDMDKRERYTQVFTLSPSSTGKMYSLKAIQPEIITRNHSVDSVAHWNGVVYRGADQNHALLAFYLSKGKFRKMCTADAGERRPNEVESYCPGEERSGPRPTLLVNENFLVIGSETKSFEFYSFDEDIDWAGLKFRDVREH